jgi:hypothetical protein
MSLQIPAEGVGRPASVNVLDSSSHNKESRKQQQRVSHSVVQSSSQPAEQPSTTNGYPDVYSHPAALAYAAAHPRRQIPKFGPYLLLQTLGEGEFGKVKLGLHCQWGEEVAVKLIRRGNVGDSVRMGKVEREIEVLRVRFLNSHNAHTHPNRRLNIPTSSVFMTLLKLTNTLALSLNTPQEGNSSISSSLTDT